MRARQFSPQCVHQRTTLRLTQPTKTKHLAGQLLMLKQGIAALIHGAKLSEIGRNDLQLLTEISPEHRRHDAHRIEYAAAHA